MFAEYETFIERLTFFFSQRLHVFIRIFHEVYYHQSFAFFQSQLDRLGEASFDLLFDDKPVDDYGDVVCFISVERGDGIVERVYFAIDFDSDKSLFADLLECPDVLAFSAPDDWGEGKNASLFGKAKNLIDDLLDGLLFYPPPAFVAMRYADIGEEQTEVIVYFRYCANGRAGVFADGFLLDRDRRTEPFDIIDRWFVHLIEKLPGVCGQALDVAALTFGIDRIECQR